MKTKIWILTVIFPLIHVTQANATNDEKRNQLESSSSVKSKKYDFTLFSFFKAATKSNNDTLQVVGDKNLLRKEQRVE